MRLVALIVVVAFAQPANAAPLVTLLADKLAEDGPTLNLSYLPGAKMPLPEWARVPNEFTPLFEAPSLPAPKSKPPTKPKR